MKTEFTYQGYKDILTMMVKAGYKFAGYGETVEAPVCYLRHDLDLSIEKAYPLSRIENDFQVKATYCVMLRTDAYNVFSGKNSETIEKLLKDGHHLGLHFDSRSYDKQLSVTEIRSRCLEETKILSEWFGVPVQLVSFHRPDPLVLGGANSLTGSIPHAYEKRFMGEAAYFADSFGFWRFGHPMESTAFSDREPMTINIHPVWWNAEPVSPLYALRGVVEDRKKEIREYMLTDIVGV